MKITAIELTNQDIQVIVNYLTYKLIIQDSRQKIELNLSDIDRVFTLTEMQRHGLSGLNYFTDEFSHMINIESTLELYTEYPERDENHQTAISYRSVVKFSITFFYDGEEIKVNTDKIYELINKYYEI